MEIKYEAVFGDQSLFDNDIGDSVAAINHGDVVFCFNSYNAFLIEVMKCNDLPLSESPAFAMRRIIPEPKRWTVEDQKAGKLPEVGCRIYVPMMLEEQNVIYSSEKVIVSISDNEGAVTRTEVGAIDRIKPIETSKEKAARLRSEWCNRAMDYSTIQQLYDAMLSGELAVPVAPEQNK